MLTIAERKRIIAKAKKLLGLPEKETKNEDVIECIIELIDAGVDEAEAQSICEDLYGDE